MKRSEMIEHLKLETDNWLSHSLDYSELNLILQCLERQGMLPPPFICDIPDIGIITTRDWEPEVNDNEGGA